MMLSWNVLCCLLVTVYAQQPNEGNFYNKQPAANLQRTYPTSYSNGHAVFPQNNWMQWKSTSVSQGVQNIPPNSNGLKTPFTGSNNFQREAPASSVGSQGTQSQIYYNGQRVPPPQVYNGQGRQTPNFNYDDQRAKGFLSGSYNEQNATPLKYPQSSSPENYNTRTEVQPITNYRLMGASPNTFNAQIPPASHNVNARQGFQTLNYNRQTGTPIAAGQSAPSPQNLKTRQNRPLFNNNEQREITSSVYKVRSVPSPQNNLRQGVQPVKYNDLNKTQLSLQKFFPPSNNNEPNIPSPTSNNDRTGSLSNYNNQKLLIRQSNNGPNNVLTPNNNAQRVLVPYSSNYNTKDSQLFNKYGQRESLTSTNPIQRFHLPSSTNQFSSPTGQSSTISNPQGKSLDSQFLRSASTNSQIFLPPNPTSKSSEISSSQGESLDSRFLRSSSSNGGIKGSSMTNTTPLPHNNNKKISDNPLASSKVPLEFHKELEREI